MHLAVGYAAIANGGRASTQSDRGAGAEPVCDVGSFGRKFGKNVAGVVTDGTASMGEVTGYAVAGKTVPVDKPSAWGRYEKDKVIATFASIFPAHDPKYVLVVTLDEPEDTVGSEARRTAGWTAVPVAAEIIRRIAPLMGLRPGLKPMI